MGLKSATINAYDVIECPALAVLKKTEQLSYLHVFLSEEFIFRIIHKKYHHFSEIILDLVHWASDRSG